MQNIIEFLKKNGNVYYVRKLTFTDKQLEGLIYQLYIDAHRISNMTSIKEKIDYSSNSKGDKTLHVIVFDTTIKDNRSANEEINVIMLDISLETRGESKTK